MIKVSVIITTYNGAKYIEKTVNSILNQTLKEFQLVIINDGSKDSTESIIKRIKDKRIEYYYINNSGHVHALNYGLGKCKANLISILDHDDMALITKLEEQYKCFFYNRNIGVVGTSYNVIDENDKVIQKVILPSKSVEIKKQLLYRNVICHSGVMYRSFLIKEIGGYKNKYSVAADYELWLRLVKKTEFFNIKENLMLFRKHEDSLTTSINKYADNNKYSLIALIDNMCLVNDEQKYIFAIWEVLYGNVKKSRILLLKDVFINRNNLKVKLKYLMVSLLSRKNISRYYYYNPLRKLKIFFIKK